MALQKSQGEPRPGVARPDELPVGTPAPPPEPARPADRDTAGRFQPGNRTSSKGAVAKNKGDPNKWARSLGLGGLLKDLQVDARFKPFADEAQDWFRAKCVEVAETVGGGICGAGVTSIVRTAAWERAFSAWLFELAATGFFAWVRGKEDATSPGIDPRVDLAQVASRLGDSSRQNLLAAHELAAREAAARKASPVAKDSKLERRVEELIRLEKARALPARPPTVIDVAEQPLPAASTPVPPVAPTRMPAPTSAPMDRPSPIVPLSPTSAQQQAYIPTVSAERAELDALDAKYGTDGPGRVQHARAVIQLIGGWLTDTQKKHDRWCAGGRRGPRTWPARTIPAPYSTTWLRVRPKGEAEVIERDYLWTFAREDVT